MTRTDLHTQATRRPPMPGSWQLPPGNAMTLTATTASTLYLVQGCLWITSEGPHGSTPDQSGDRFLRPGEQLVVAAGQRLVMEPYGARDGGSAWFQWDAVALPHLAESSVASPWRAFMAQPLVDLRAAAVLGLDAVVRLTLGLVAWAWASLGRREAVGLAACACKAQAKA